MLASAGVAQLAQAQLEVGVLPRSGSSSSRFLPRGGCLDLRYAVANHSLRHGAAQQLWSPPVEYRVVVGAEFRRATL